MTSSRRWLRPAMPAVAALTLLAACASTPAPNPRLDAARSALEQARSNTARVDASPVEYNRATAAVQRADRAWRANDDRLEVDHLAALAQKQVELATATSERKEVETLIQQSARERDAVQLDASRRQASSLAAQNTALLAANDQAKQRADALASKLAALEAKQTDRGLVVTFSDVLFDTGRAELRRSALARVNQLAAVMQEYPERSVLVEGFTDSTGSLATNQALSERRAMAVRNALMTQGVAGTRIVSRGLADRYPVAGNETASGRAQNRRVEAVLSDPNGKLPYRD